jgi:hypothetical protein
MTIANTEPTKRNLITLVNRFVLIVREHADIEEECWPGRGGPLCSALDGLKTLIENDFEAGCDLSFADMGEEFVEALLCCCPLTEGGNHVIDEGVHHPDCDMWDSKAGYEPETLEEAAADIRRTMPDNER